MYKVYLKSMDMKLPARKKLETKTIDPLEAEAAFKQLLTRSDLVGTKTRLVLSLDNQQLMLHRFDRSPGDRDFVADDQKIILSPWEAEEV